MTDATPKAGIPSFSATVTTIISIAAAVALAYPGKIPFLSDFVKASPVIAVSVPLAITIAGVLYAAASKPIRWLRKLMPWRSELPPLPSPPTATL